MTRLALLFCLLLLAACGPANDGLALQDDYLQRLPVRVDEHVVLVAVERAVPNGGKMY